MKTKLFVSKSLNEQSPLLSFCKRNDWEVIDRSLIYFEDIPFEIKKEFDIVFISSIRAFEFFMEGFRGNPETLKFAVAGKSTAQQMNVENSQIEFIVDKSGDIPSSSQEFVDWLENRNVIFPVSQISNNSYSKLVKEDRKEVVICYKTLSYPTEVDDCEYYVFTSPSNVKSFLLKNVFPVSAKVIAWGTTTEEYLRKKEIAPVHVLTQSSEEELVEFLSRLG